MKRKVLLIGIVAVIVTVGWFTLRPGQHFDVSLWKNRSTPEDVRLTMADDLIARRRLEGLTRQEAVNLLGEPDAGDLKWFEEYDLVYWLGTGRVSPDSEWLVVKLGSDGRVEIARILSD